jgi:hypothetical protein
VKARWRLLFVVFMVGCTPTSPTSNLNNSSVLTSIPQPDDFDKNRDGKTVLIELNKSINFSRENNNVGDFVRLFPENYRETEDVWVPYATAEGPALDPTFTTRVWTENEWDTTIAQLTSPTQEAFLALLQSWLPFDDVFVYREEVVNFKDLSHEFYGGDYYWFNNHIDTYTTRYARMDNQFITGRAEVQRTFQTLNEISFERLHDVQFNDDTIFSLQDETFPAGYFGAVDQKLMTPRAGNNTKHALSLGPARYLLDTLAYWDYLIQMSQSDNTISPYALQFTFQKLADDDLNLQFNITQPLESLRTEEYYEHVVDVQIRQREWVEFHEASYLWLADHSEG